MTRNVSTTYYYLGSQRVAMQCTPSGSYSGTLYWIQGDQLGSASLTTNITGAVVSEQRDYPFGETRWVRGTMLTDRLYTGAETVNMYVSMGSRVRQYPQSMARHWHVHMRGGIPQNATIVGVTPHGLCFVAVPIQCDVAIICTNWAVNPIADVGDLAVDWIVSGQRWHQCAPSFSNQWIVRRFELFVRQRVDLDHATHDALAGKDHVKRAQARRLPGWIGADGARYRSLDVRVCQWVAAGAGMRILSCVEPVAAEHGHILHCAGYVWILCKEVRSC
jgi:hypothetical protein